ncbi:MAG: hypothetical protein PHI63_05770 [Patescibacteria group bacterium]|nr:hypothetical protein [Patescibacteria group bacterium]
MSRRTKIIIIVALVIVAVLLLTLLAMAPRPYDLFNPSTSPTPTPTAGLPVAGGTVSVPVATPITREPRTQATIEALARTFTERYGSYSSQSGLINLRELGPLMTQRLAATAPATLQRTLPASGFYGVTTKVLGTEIISLNQAETEAQLVMQTQRTETAASGVPKNLYQKLTLKLVKEAAGWKVDQADWQ